MLRKIFSRKKTDENTFEDNDKPGIFKKLTPINDADLSIYKEAIKTAFKDSDIKNIAISGVYGSGKSSVVNSFEKSDFGAQYKWLHVSLAALGNDVNSEDNDVEGRIINQLLYQIDSELVPLSRFKTKRDNDEYENTVTFIQLTIFILCVLQNIFFDSIIAWARPLRGKLVPSIISVITDPFSRITTISAIIIILLIWIRKIIDIAEVRPIIQKITFRGNSLELFEQKDDSLFDRYLDELIYMIEKSEVDALVFEDIDRFDNVNIFLRLREINYLINARLGKTQDQKKVIKFLYLIKDEIFTSTDRTKFFDIIIPIVPIMTSGNAYTILKGYIEESPYKEYISSDVIRGISVFINEKRLLDNIFNEFLIYANNIKDTNLSYEKLLGVIAYKNVFPNDYSRLHTRRGFVYSLFKNKKEYIASAIKDNDTKIVKIQDDIKTVEAEHLKSTEELETVNTQKVSVLTNSRNFGNREEINKKLEAWRTEYGIRKSALEDGRKKYVASKNKEIFEIREEENNLKSMTVKEIIEKYGEEVVYKFLESKDDSIEYIDIIESLDYPLIKYLIREGLISENYADYMTIFHETVLTRNDYGFISGLYGGKEQFEYEIQDAKRVVEETPIERYSRREILNYQIAEELLSDNCYAAKLELFIKTIRKYGEYDFAERLYIRTGSRSYFVFNINSIWPEFFETVMRKWSSSSLSKYAIDTLEVGSYNNIQNVNENNILADYVSVMINIVDDAGRDIDAICNSLISIGVKFKDLNTVKDSDELLKLVIENNLYEPFISNFLIAANDKESLIRINKVGIIEALYSAGNESVQKYFKDNIGTFINEMVNAEEEILPQSDTGIKIILESVEINFEHKQMFIAKQPRPIEFLDKISSEEIISELLRANKVEPTYQNAIYAHMMIKLNELVADFINSVFVNCYNYKYIFAYTKEVLGKVDYPTDEVEDVIFEFYSACLKSSMIEKDTFKNIVRSLNIMIETTEPSMPENHIEAIIEVKALKYSKEALLLLRRDYSNCVINYIINNLDDYLKDVKDEKLECIEAQVLLSEKDNVVSQKKKIEIIQLTKELLVPSHNYKRKINSEIIRKGVDANNLQVYFDLYKNLDDEAKKSIISMAVANEKMISDGDYVIEEPLLSDLGNYIKTIQVN